MKIPHEDAVIQAVRRMACSAVFYEVKSVEVVAVDWWHAAQVLEPGLLLASLSALKGQMEGMLRESQIRCTLQSTPASANSRYYPVRSTLVASCNHHLPWPW
jgi:hypothetical protein